MSSQRERRKTKRQWDPRRPNMAAGPSQKLAFCRPENKASNKANDLSKAA